MSQSGNSDVLDFMAVVLVLVATVSTESDGKQPWIL